ncbi:cyclic AMP-dependent transcription factor ATF-3 isoform X1 [Ovis aries]|nr:cyclic AMP-dependent transcription factor ATF-3 isoform X1 [Ovis aries]XP_060252703.1 cyclic AMP-dependent transcription factor ATF-3 isoform X1 [Ovis aries]XP_060252705.1 cyclic AMP-dependent transcription factor ATF-3 isoform X1 [Ovis aries]
MMLQHPGQVSASEVSASAIVPCLSPPGSLVFEDFANLTPFVKEELRFAIQNKHLCHRMSSALDSVTVSGRPLEMSVTKAEVAPEEDERKKRRRERNKIAAAKCRNKKKEKTECLQKVSACLPRPSRHSHLAPLTSRPTLPVSSLTPGPSDLTVPCGEEFERLHPEVLSQEGPGSWWQKCQLQNKEVVKLIVR